MFKQTKICITCYSARGSQCTVVDKAIIKEILDFELGSFLEGLGFVTKGKKRIFGFSLN